MNPEDLAVDLVKLADGELVGRSRLQWTAYLMDRSGGGFGLEYRYEDYGPFSVALEEGWKDAKTAGRLAVEERAGRHGVRYAVSTLGEREVSKEIDTLGELSAHEAQTRWNKMAERSINILELTAAMVYLRQDAGLGIRTCSTLKLYKGYKAEDRHLRSAMDLARELGLPTVTPSEDRDRAPGAGTDAVRT